MKARYEDFPFKERIEGDLVRKSEVTHWACNRYRIIHLYSLGNHCALS